jgi:hypothetical protein
LGGLGEDFFGFIVFLRLEGVAEGWHGKFGVTKAVLIRGARFWGAIRFALLAFSCPPIHRVGMNSPITGSLIA